MERSKKIIFISHCILNQNSVVDPLARSKGAYKDIIETIMKNNIGIHQLPCPEFRYLGMERKPMSKEEYDTENFRIICKDISLDTINIMKEYINSKYEIIGIIGINNSPTCSINNRKGILMEELLKELEKNEINIPLIDVPTDYYDGNKGEEFIIELEKFINKK